MLLSLKYWQVIFTYCLSFSAKYVGFSHKQGLLASFTNKSHLFQSGDVWINTLLITTMNEMWNEHIDCAVTIFSRANVIISVVTIITLTQGFSSGKLKMFCSKCKLLTNWDSLCIQKWILYLYIRLWLGPDEEFSVCRILNLDVAVCWVLSLKATVSTLVICVHAHIKEINWTLTQPEFWYWHFFCTGYNKFTTEIQFPGYFMWKIARCVILRLAVGQ
jgi:hypothetical protein